MNIIILGSEFWVLARYILIQVFQYRKVILVPCMYRSWLEYD